MSKNLAILVLAISGVCGCGGGSSFAPVEGIVTLDGNPVADASVVLGPMRATDPGPFTGSTDAQGKYSLGTADDPGGGAAPGEYFVNITTVKPIPGADESTPPPTQKEIIPMAYRDGSQRIVIPAGGTSAANFDISSR